MMVKMAQQRREELLAERRTKRAHLVRMAELERGKVAPIERRLAEARAAVASYESDANALAPLAALSDKAATQARDSALAELASAEANCVSLQAMLDERRRLIDLYEATVAEMDAMLDSNTDLAAADEVVRRYAEQRRIAQQVAVEREQQTRATIEKNVAARFGT